MTAAANKIAPPEPPLPVSTSSALDRQSRICCRYPSSAAVGDIRRSAANSMRILIITMCILIVGCVVSPRPSDNSKDSELSAAERLAAIEIRSRINRC